MKHTDIALIIPLAMLLANTGVYAQKEQPEQTDKLPEEITVFSPAALKNMRIELERAEEAMFNVFNELNDDDRFDVHCYNPKRYGSKIRQRQCMPNYYLRILEEEAELVLARAGHVAVMTNGIGVSDLERFNAIFKDIVQETINTRPEFIEALSHFEMLKENYDARRRQWLDRQ